MEKIASLVIIIGTGLWFASILFMESRWQVQALAAVILIIGIFLAHFWEEVFRKED